MKFYIPFGDWSSDGHGCYDEVLVEAESMEKLLEAEQKIKKEYGENFFQEYAQDYDDPKISSTCWQALIDNNFPVSVLKDSVFLSEEETKIVNSIEDFLNKIDCDPYLSLEFIEKSFIWLLNQYEAGIKIISKAPQINNWTCEGFETVGYGCF